MFVHGHHGHQGHHGHHGSHGSHGYHGHPSDQYPHMPVTSVKSSVGIFTPGSPGASADGLTVKNITSIASRDTIYEYVLHTDS